MVEELFPNVGDVPHVELRHRARPSPGKGGYLARPIKALNRRDHTAQGLHHHASMDTLPKVPCLPYPCLKHTSYSTGKVQADIPREGSSTTCHPQSPQGIG